MANTLRSRLRDPVFRKDLTAVCAFLAVFGLIALTLRNGVGITDEGFYYTVVERVLRGDRLIADEWQVTQLQSVLVVFPYRLCTLLLGGTQGIVPAMRGLFVLCQFVLGLHLWRRMRAWGYPALLFILTLCSFGPLFTFIYYNIALNAAAIVATELFFSPAPPGRPKLVFLGIVAAVGVVAEPLLSIAYFAYTLQVWFLRLRKKTKGNNVSLPLPTVRVWAWLTVGVAIAAGVFLTYLLRSYGWNLRVLFDSVPYIFTDYEYNFGMFGENSHFSRLFTLLKKSPYYFGYVNTAIALLNLGFAAWLRIKGKGKRLGRCAFLIATASAAFAYLRAAVLCFFFGKGTPIIFYVLISGFGLPLFVYTAVLLLISQVPPPWASAFLHLSVTLSLLVDFSSDACLAYGGVLSILPALVLLADCGKRCHAHLRNRLTRAFPSLAGKRGPAFLLEAFLAECLPPAQKSPAGKKKNAKTKTKAKAKTNKTPERGKKADAFPARLFRSGAVRMLSVRLCGAALALAVCFCSAENLTMRVAVPFIERFAISKNAWEPLDRTLQNGPLKGIRTAANVAELYEKTLADLNTFRDGRPGPLYVDGRCPLPYIYTGRPIGVYSAWYVEEDNPSRVVFYWKLYPERIPAYIYVPKYNASNYILLPKEETDEKLRRLTGFFDCEVTDGQAGYILRIDGVKTLDWPDSPLPR